jgi:Xanthomonas XOO_2897-like deaminase
MSEFPAQAFRMEGDPSAIRSSAAKWTSFGAAATEASAQITQLDTTEFVGPEGDQFRDGLNKDMPEHLRITGDAFSKVSTALNGFAGTLDSLQDQMRPLAQRAPALWQAVQAAQGRVDRAHQDDQRHEREMAARPPDSTEPDTYRSDTGSATAALSQAQREWEDCLNQANGLRASLTAAVRDCVGQIRQAKDMRFKENPKWWDIKGQFTNFVRDNKDLLQKLSGALKVVSLVSGLLSFIPVLAPICGPIALGTALAASAIDLSVYAATGEGNLKMILIDAGLTLLPGVGKLANRMRMLSQTGRVGYATTDLGVAVKTARGALPNAQTLRNAAVFEYESGGSRVLSEVGWSRPGYHAERAIWQDLERAGVKPEQVKRIFSELEPCITPTPQAGCKTFIANTFPNAKVTWAIDYGDQASRDAANLARTELFEKLFPKVGGTR